MSARIIVALLLLVLCASAALPLDSPWISDTYFYWYTWDYRQELGGWMGGVYNTPLRGYYHSPSYEDNLIGLRQASDWGLTHHFMDYWGPGWKADDGSPREDLLIRATEALQQAGYDIHMSVYQDGTDFDMAQFAKNLDPGRDTEFYVRRYAKSPATPLVGGKPVYLVYGRNGMPKTTGTSEGFRQWLERKYGTTAALNARWGTNYGGFGEIGFDLSAKGHQRADSIKYQYALWAEEMGRVNSAAGKLDLPGCLFSWDVGYQPFGGYSYSDQARVFCGPHSYGGIFGVPHDQDAERFIQAAVAKRYNTVFFDTFKNFYHDWEIRIPGTCYPPDFSAFDRFWVQALSHYSEALLHLSWNEWWEGSNLEPCEEYGKTYCEKNLLYATIMKQCFPSIREWNRGAKVAVLLNDWHWLAGGRHPEDIYACIQALRRCSVRFDLLPDDFVTAAELGKFDTVVAPSGGVGFGCNAAAEPIPDLLLSWAQDPSHRLIIDDYPGLAERLKLPRATRVAAAAAAPGPDLNVFVDVGEEGDEKFLVEGFSNREDWGKIPADKFGATDRTYTVRWTPAAGSATVLILPLSPQREHVLRLSGSALWDNRVEVLIDGAPAAAFDLKSGRQEYEVKIPAAAVGNRASGEIMLRYAKGNVPRELDPQKFESEGRVCNLAIDWLQLATSNLPLSREQKYRLPEAGVQFTAAAPRPLAGKRLPAAYAPHLPLAAGGGTLSSYLGDGAARDLVTGAGKNILYVNGLFSAPQTPDYLRALLTGWARAPEEMRTFSDDVIVTPLRSGLTDILLAYNYAAPQPREFAPFPPQRPDAPPVVELHCLSRDGGVPANPDVQFGYAGGALVSPEKIKYYGVYQATRGWLQLDTPALALTPGQTKQFTVTLTGIDWAGKPHNNRGRVRLISHLPTLTSDAADFSVRSGKKVTVPLTVTARADADWGRKTVIIDVEADGAHSYFWRGLQVLPRPQLAPAPWAIDSAAPVTAVHNEVRGSAVPHDLTVTPEQGRAISVPGPLTAPVSVDLRLPRQQVTQPALRAVPVKLSWQSGGVADQREVSVSLADYPQAFARPPGGLQPLLVCNTGEEYLENVPVSLARPDLLRQSQLVHVRDRQGRIVPSQVVAGEPPTLWWVAMLPPRSVVLYYLCGGEAPPPPTDLVVRTGKETVLANSRVTLGWDGSQGGTLTRLRSARSGLDYAAGSCGAGAGSWGRYDPLKPAINTLDFVGQERKAWQRDGKAPLSVRVLRQGPVLATVEVTALAGPAHCRQTYTLFAYQSGFRVTGSVDTAAPAEELVALDLRFARHGLTKIFPNFTGIGEGFSGDQPDAGWREAPYVPPYATIMAPDSFPESVSVIPVTGQSDCTRFRQGFWPKQRPQPGSVQYAEIEFARPSARKASAAADVLLHPGHQVVAKAYRRTHVEAPPTVIAPRGFRWEGELPEPSVGAGGDWWNPYWHYAVAVTAVPPTEAGADPSVSFRLDSGRLLAGRGQLDPGSPRAVVRTGQTVSELPTAYAADTDEVTVTLVDEAWPAPAPAVREFRLYFDTLDTGPKRGEKPLHPQAERLLNGDFEREGEHWTLDGGAAVAADQPGRGRCARLEYRDGAGPCVISNDTCRLSPDSRYRLTFWAKTSTAGAAIRTNLYSGARYDFPQFALSLAPDGDWHRYQQVLATGAFPYGVRPALRLWVLGTPQVVWVDDVTLEPLEVQAPQAVPVELGEVLAR